MEELAEAGADIVALQEAWGFMCLEACEISKLVVILVLGGTQPRAPCVGAHFKVLAGACVHWSRQQPSKLQVGACRRVALSLAAALTQGMDMC